MHSVRVIFGIDDIFFFPEYKDYWENLLSFLSSNKNIKATFFTVSDYRFKKSFYPIRLIEKYLNIYLPSFSSENLLLSKHPEFIKKLHELIKEKRTEIAAHGETHLGPPKNPAREFAGLKVQSIDRKLEIIKQEFNKYGFPIPVGFSSPGWEYSDILLQSLKTKNFNYVASSFDSHTLISLSALSNQAGIKNVPLLEPSILKEGLLNIPRNVTLDSDAPIRALQIAKIGGIVSVHAHLYPIGVQNSLSNENLFHLKDIISALSEKYILDFKLFKDIKYVKK